MLFGMEQEVITIKNPLPFSPDSLVKSNISKSHTGEGTFFESRDLPGKVIRLENSDELIERHHNKIPFGELVRTGKELFAELVEKYGIAVPVTFYERNGEVYSVVDKVTEAEEISEEEKKEHASKISKLYASIASYFLDKLKGGDLYLWDICGASQYVYGKREGDEKNNVYLIDTDIWLGNSRSGLCLTMYWLTRHMSASEKKFGAHFADARSSISDFIQTLPDDLDDEEKLHVSEIKKLLNGINSDYRPQSAIPTFE